MIKTRNTLLLMVLFMLPYSVQAQESVYTSLEEKSCKTLESGSAEPEDGGGDSFSMLCPGRDGFDVRVDGGDSRSWIVMVKGGQESYNSMSDISNRLTGNFPYVAGKVLEWRYDSAKKLAALIVRINTQDENDTNKNNSDLIVIRHVNNTFCYLGSDKTNEGARKIADASKGCQP